MVSRVKGITIEFDGETNGLDKALSSINTEANRTNKELKDVNKLLKLDPGNTELIAQKQRLLAEAVGQSEEKLTQLKSAQAQVNQQFAAGKIDESQYRAFNREIQETEGTLGRLKSELQTTKSAQDRYATASSNIEKFTKATKTQISDFASVLGTRLTNSIKNGTASADDMERALQLMGKESGVSGDKMDELRAALTKIDGDNVQGLEKDLKSLGVGSGDANGKLGQLRDGVKAINFQDMADGLSQAKDALIDFGKNAMEAWTEQDDALDNMTVKTGATGKAAEALGDAYNSIMGKMPIDDTNDLSNAIAGLSNKFDVSNKDLTGMSEKLMQFSAVTGQSGTDAVDGLHDAMSRFGMDAKDLPSVMDAFASASQSSGVPVDELQQLAIKSASSFEAMGVSLTDGIGIVANWDKAGVDATTALTGMRKASVEYAKENVSLSDGLTQTYNAVKNATSPQEALNAATEAFGTKAGPALAQAISNGRMSLDDLKKSSEDTSGSVKKSYEATLDPVDKMKVKQQEAKKAMADVGALIQETFLPIFEKIVPVIENIVKWFQNLSPGVQSVIVIVGLLVIAIGFIAPIIATVASAFVAIGGVASAVIVGIVAAIAIVIAIVMNWGTIVDWLKGVWNTISEFFIGLWEGIKSTFTNVINAISEFLKSMFNGISRTTKNIWNGIKTYFTNVFNNIKTLITDIWNAIKSTTQNVWNAIRSFVSNLIKNVQSIINNIFNGIKNTITNIWNAIKNTTQNVWNAIRSFISNLIKNVRSIIDNVFNGIKNAISNVWNSVKNTTQNVWNSIRSFINGLIKNVQSIIDNVMNAIRNTISNIWNAIRDTTSNVWNGIKSFISGLVNGIRDTISNVFNAAAGIVSNIFNNIRNTASNIWNGIKDAISGAVDGAKNIVSNVFNSIAGTVSSIFNGIRNTVSGIWNGIKDAISGPINTARDLVRGAIDAIKGFFNFSFSWPKIPLPHFSIRPAGWSIGDLVKGKIPSLGIEWYANGGIFNKPTLFATGSGMAGVGEAGPEAVLPLNKSTLAGIGAGIADAMNGGQPSVVINQYFNGPQDESMREAMNAAKRSMQQMGYEISR